MTGPTGFVWDEVVTPDQKKSGEFYSALLGWDRHEVDAGPLGIYTLFRENGRDVAGMMDPTSDYSRARPTWWNSYVHVNNVDAAAAGTASLGGQVVEPPTDVPGVWRACMVADPLGAVLCLATPTSSNEQRPRAEVFVWHHLVTSDQERSGAFYTALLGWTRREVDAGPFGTYSVFQQDGHDLAGMMNPTLEFTRSRPSAWYSYAVVPDVDATAARVQELGGTQLSPVHEVPGFGRVCLLGDPLGAVLTLVTPGRVG